MKNTILTFFLIIPLISIAAKYYPGKAVKTDGTELIGYFEEPDFAAVKRSWNSFPRCCVEAWAFSR